MRDSDCRLSVRCWARWQALSALARFALRAQAESFVGRPVLLDPRIAVPECGGGISIGWREGAGQVLLAACASSDRRSVILVAGAERMLAAPALVKRDDPVLVQAGGPVLQCGWRGWPRATHGRAGNGEECQDRRTGVGRSATKWAALAGWTGWSALKLRHWRLSSVLRCRSGPCEGFGWLNARPARQT